MIISDLKHFEEVSSEAPRIVGGLTTTTFSTKLSSDILNQLSAKLKALLKDLKGQVTTVKITENNLSASVTTGVFKKGNLNISVSASSSVSSSVSK